MALPKDLYDQESLYILVCRYDYLHDAALDNVEQMSLAEYGEYLLLREYLKRRFHERLYITVKREYVYDDGSDTKSPSDDVLYKEVMKHIVKQFPDFTDQYLEVMDRVNSYFETISTAIWYFKEKHRGEILYL